MIMQRRSLPTSLGAMLAIVTMPLLGGCVARAAADIVTAPVRIVSRGADLATTSQSESDEKRGRALRRQEERLGRLEREYNDHNRQCLRGNDDACIAARNDYGEIQNLRAGLSAAPYR